jgi:hypothetical protein
LREYLPQFARAGQTTCVAGKTSSDVVIELDLDAHYADAWQLYSSQYLAAVKSGRVPQLRTAGTGTTSADCPLVAVANTPLNGHNPPQSLNAEFNAVEIRQSPAEAWREVHSGEAVEVRRGAPLYCRASLGNTAEAAWVARPSGQGGAEGLVRLGCLVGPSKATLEPLRAGAPAA